MSTSTLQMVAIGMELRSLPLILAVLTSWLGSFGYATERSVARSQPSSLDGDITMTIVYDNNPGQEGLTTAWGFACVIQGLEKSVLFDTGGNGRLLLENMRRLNLDPKGIDVVVLSHIHGDHTGGLSSFLRVRTGVPVYIPTGFPPAFKERVRSLGARPEEAIKSVGICRGVRTTGTLGKGAIEEHGLCVKVGKGWVLITGCAHPGVADMAAQAKQVTGESVHLVVGGFHMGSQPEAKINAAIDRFEKLGVQRVAPCHCSGDRARRLFRQRFGDRCILAGVGTVLQFERDK